jgi:tetratricopeptide (TPR) repeat protein
MKLFFSRMNAVLVAVFALALTGFAAPPNDLLSSGRVSEAVVSLSNHNDAQSLNLLSRAYYAMECWDDAVKYGERAVQLEPNNALYHLWLGREYGRKAAASKPFAAASNAKKAKVEFERAVQLDPSNVPARLDLAQYYTEAPGFMGGGLDKAREQAEQVAKYDPAAAHLMLARVAAKQKQFGEAESQFRAAVKQAKNPADMWLKLAGFYREQGRLDEMQSAVHSAVAQPNKPTETYFDAANELYLGGRDYAGAVQYLQKYLASGELVESAPAFRAHYLIGQLQEKFGRGSAAAAEYQASIKMAAGFAPARQALDHVQ